MADQTFERNSGRPHHDTGEIGDFLNSLPDREYWAAHGMWYQKPESQDKTFEEYVHESDAERREQARYDEVYAARRKYHVQISSPSLLTLMKKAARIRLLVFIAKHISFVLRALTVNIRTTLCTAILVPGATIVLDPLTTTCEGWKTEART